MTSSDNELLNDNSPRPQVAVARRSRAPLIFGVVLTVAATGLFSALEARRAGLSSPAISMPRDAAGARLASPPALAIPQELGSDFGFDAGRSRGTLEGISDDEIALLLRSGPASPPMPERYRLARAETPNTCPGTAPPARRPEVAPRESRRAQSRGHGQPMGLVGIPDDGDIAQNFPLVYLAFPRFLALEETLPCPALMPSSNPTWWN